MPTATGSADRQPLGQQRRRAARPPSRGSARTGPGRRRCRTTPRTADADADARPRRWRCPASTDRLSRSTWRSDLARPVLAARLPHLAPVQHHAAEPDPGHDQVVDADVDGEHVHPLGLRARPRATAGRPRRGPTGGPLADQAGVGRARRSAPPMVLRLSPSTAVSSARDVGAVDVQRAQQGSRGCAGGPRPGSAPASVVAIVPGSRGRPGSAPSTGRRRPAGGRARRRWRRAAAPAPVTM